MYRNVLLVAVLVLCVCAVSSCKKKSDDALVINRNTITMVIDGTINITYKDVHGAGAHYYISGDGAIPPNSMAVVAINGRDPDMVLTFEGTAPGPYTIAGGTAVFSCSDDTGQVYAAMQALGHTSGTVTVAAVGAVGERVQGTFTITADEYNGANPSGLTVVITGTFDCVRRADMP